MSVLVGFDTRLVVQGVGSAGTFHAKQMIEYGTKVVAGVTPNRGGTRFHNDVPIFHTVQEAVKDVGLQVPLVVRLEGTNVDLGKEIIAKSNLNVTSADDLDDAAQKIVAAVKELG